MQQVSITKALLKRFSTEYIRLPDVNIENPVNVRGEYILIVAWMSAMSHDPHGMSTRTLSAAFSGWLLGQDMFVLMDEEQETFEKAFMELFKEALPNGYLEKS